MSMHNSAGPQLRSLLQRLPQIPAPPIMTPTQAPEGQSEVAVRAAFTIRQFCLAHTLLWFTHLPDLPWLSVSSTWSEAIVLANIRMEERVTEL